MYNCCRSGKNLRLYEETRKNLVLQKQPFTDVSKMSAFKNFAKFSNNTNTGVCSCRPPAWIFIKKETPAQMFSVSFAKFLRTPF